MSRISDALNALRPHIQSFLEAHERREKAPRKTCPSCQFEHQVTGFCMNPNCPENYYRQYPQ